MKSIYIFFLSLILTTTLFSKNNTDSTIKATINPKNIFSNNIEQNIDLIIENYSTDTLVFLNRPYFAFGDFLGNVSDCWYWPIKKFTNVIFFEDINKSLNFTGDCDYEIKFGHSTRLNILYPNCKLKINLKLNDYLMDYCKSKDIILYAFISYAKYRDIICFLENANVKSNDYSKYFCNDSCSSSKLIQFKDIDIFNKDIPDGFIDSLIKNTFTSGLNVPK